MSNIYLPKKKWHCLLLIRKIDRQTDRQTPIELKVSLIYYYLNVFSLFVIGVITHCCQTRPLVTLLYLCWFCESLRSHPRAVSTLWENWGEKMSISCPIIYFCSRFWGFLFFFLFFHSIGYGKEQSQTELLVIGSEDDVPLLLMKYNILWCEILKFTRVNLSVCQPTGSWQDDWLSQRWEIEKIKSWSKIVI